MIERPEGRLNNLLLLFVCIKSNGKVLEATLAGFNSDDVKTTLRRLCCFKMVLPLLQALQQSLPIHLSLCYTQYTVLRMALKVNTSHSSW